MKSAKQIYAQADRILHNMAVSSWNGKEYVNHAGLMKRLEMVRDICEKYVNNIYNHEGVNRYECSADVANRVFVTEVARGVYMR